MIACDVAPRHPPLVKRFHNKIFISVLPASHRGNWLDFSISFYWSTVISRFLIFMAAQLMWSWIFGPNFSHFLSCKWAPVGRCCHKYHNYCHYNNHLPQSHNYHHFLHCDHLCNLIVEVVFVNVGWKRAEGSLEAPKPRWFAQHLEKFTIGLYCNIIIQPVRWER